jgi:multidrug resistance efflux pump
MLKMKKLSFPLLISGLLLAACSGTATPTPDAGTVPVVSDSNLGVIAEGKLLPGQYANLSFATSGKVAEVLVTKGQTVAADAVIARLENSEALKAQVVQAQGEVLNAQQAITTLNDNVSMLHAQAQADQAAADKALDDASRHLKNLNYPDIQYYKDEIQKAQDALTTAQENVTVVDIGSLQAALQAAHNATDDLKERLDKLQTAAAGCPTCDPEGSFTVDHIPQSVADARDNYNDGLNRIKELEIQIAQAQRGNTQTIKDAQDHLDDTLDNLASAQSGPKPLDQERAEADVALAAAQKKDAEDRLTKLQNGPDPDQLASAQAHLATAQANLAAAQDALTNSELHAPFAGVIADLSIKVGEQASPAAPAAVLADFSQWIVETDNLTEIEVVKVNEGQKASIVLDALPDVTLHGTVSTISPVFEEKRGDVTYTVTVKLTDSDPHMRWGMTAVTTFEK